jgi:hypothetical protein
MMMMMMMITVAISLGFLRFVSVHELRRRNFEFVLFVLKLELC